MKPEPARYSVRDLVENEYSHLAIPHFQRGLVWGRDAVASLLESLFLGTPCGSFVLWDSGNNRDNGKPLVEASTEITHLIVDGQQRIRSLYEAWNDIDSSSDDEDGEGDEASPGAKRVWCLNLTRVTELAGALDPSQSEFPFFRFVSDPTIPREKGVRLYNLVPWGLLRSDKSLKDYTRLLRPSSKLDDAALVKLLEKARELVKPMADEKLFSASVITETDRAKVVGLYNRINSGGRRVEKEERTFAQLVAVHPGTWDEIAAIFEAVHGKASDTGSRTEHDQVLKRLRERQFGFKLFVRTFLEAAAYHFGYLTGMGSESFGIIDKIGFQRQLASRAPEDLDFLWHETSETLVLLSHIIQEDLRCDALQFLPDSTSLLPLIHLLIACPEMREERFRPLLASLILKLQLASLPGDRLEKLTISQARSTHVVFRWLSKLNARLDEEMKRILGPSGPLSQPSALSSRYVLLLYWLERRKKAKDFSYAPFKGKPAFGCPERAIAKSVAPEKQHLLPLSRLQAVFGEKDVKRSQRHDFNRLGNLTYLSHDLNGLDGYADKPANLNDESPDNLEKHFIPADGDKALKGSYTELAERLEDTKRPGDGELKRAYLHFCANREQLIAAGFKHWLEELDQKALDDLKVESLEASKLQEGAERPEACVPRFVDSGLLPPEQILRRLDLDNAIEDLLIGQMRDLRNAPKKEQGKGSRPAVKRLASGLAIALTPKRTLTLEVDRHGVFVRLPQNLSREERLSITSALGLTEGKAALHRRGEPACSLLAERIKAATEISRSLEQADAPRPESTPRTIASLWATGFGEERLHAMEELLDRFERAGLPGIKVEREKKPAILLALPGKKTRSILRVRENEPDLADELDPHSDGSHSGAIESFRKRLHELFSDASQNKHSQLRLPVLSALEQADALIRCVGDFEREYESAGD